MATATRFDVEVKFSGLCAFIPDDELAKAKNLCVVLVNGTDPDILTKKRKALDDNELRYHRGIIRIPFANVSSKNSPPEAADVLWYIKPGTRMSFSTRPKKASRGNLDIDIKAATKTNQTSFHWVAAMKKVIDPPCDIDPDALSPTPSSNILAQVLIRGGKVQTTNLPKTLWEYRPQVASKTYLSRFAHGVSVFYYGVTRASIAVTDVKSGNRREIRLKPDKDGKALVQVSNMCRDNSLEWELPYDSPVADQDVRWYYELLDANSRGTLKSILTKDGLPIPVPVDAGAGPDCSPHTFGFANFDALLKADS